MNGFADTALDFASLLRYFAFLPLAKVKAKFNFPKLKVESLMFLTISRKSRAGVRNALKNSILKP